MNYIDLFHGIGGFALGAYWAGMKFDNHFCSDIEPYAQELYKLRFPESIQLGDITKIDTDELKKYGNDWILSGGFPCQDISIAGKGMGIHGERSGLWFEYWRLINDLRPRFAIMENVGMLIHRGLREVLGSLAEIGYDAEWQDIRAEDVGAPHKRERIWIVAYAESRRIDRIMGDNTEKKIRNDEFNCCCENEIPDTESSKCKQPCNSRSRGNGFTDSHTEVPDTNEQGLQGRDSGELQECPAERVAREGNSQNGCSPGWSTEPAVGRLAHGVPRRVDRLKGLGNAIVPQIAEILFRQIKPYIENE
jgi:DNA (cytosine-5)-methyltransferase 1